MQTFVAYADPRHVHVENEAPSQSAMLGGMSAHAVAEGSVIAVCGAPVRDVTDRPWPPESDACPLCAADVEGFVGALPPEGT